MLLEGISEVNAARYGTFKLNTTLNILTEIIEICRFMCLEREGFVLDMIKVQYIPTNQVGATNKYNISTAGRTVPQYKHRISSVLLLSSQVLSCLHVQPTTPKQRHA